MYTYFIAYFYIDGLGRSRMGNTTIDLTCRVSNEMDIRRIESTLATRHPRYMYISVTNFQLLNECASTLSKEQKKKKKGEVLC